MEKRIISRDMLNDCLYSINCRAKNIRDTLPHNDNFKKYNYKEKFKKIRQLYKYKHQLLRFISPQGIIINNTNNRTYIFFKIHENNSYLVPLKKRNLKKFFEYNAVPIMYLNNLKTFGDDENNILSMQFINKFMQLINSKDFQFDDDLKIYIKNKYKK